MIILELFGFSMAWPQDPKHVKCSTAGCHCLTPGITHFICENRYGSQFAVCKKFHSCVQLTQSQVDRMNSGDPRLPHPGLPNTKAPIALCAHPGLQWHTVVQRYADNGNLIPRFVCFLVDFGVLYQANYLHPLQHHSKDGVFVVQPWSWHSCDEKLRPACRDI